MWTEAYTIKGYNQTVSYSIDSATCDKENAHVFMKNIINCTLVCYMIRMTYVISNVRLIMTLKKGVILIMF